MARTAEIAVAQPYPARPRWAGDFHRLEASLFADRRVAAEHRAHEFAQAFVPGRRARTSRGIRDRYVLTQLPDIPSMQIDLSLLGDDLATNASLDGPE